MSSQNDISADFEESLCDDVDFLITAIEEKDDDTIKTILSDSTFDPSKSSVDLLETAVFSDNKNALEFLLSHNSCLNPTNAFIESMRVANGTNELDIVCLLLNNKRTQVSTQDNLPFFLALENGWSGIASDIINHPNVKNKEELEKKLFDYRDYYFTIAFGRAIVIRSKEVRKSIEYLCATLVKNDIHLDDIECIEDIYPFVPSYKRFELGENLHKMPSHFKYKKQVVVEKELNKLLENKLKKNVDRDELEKRISDIIYIALYR